MLKYKKVLDNCYDVERKENLVFKYRSWILYVSSKIKEHVASVYTRDIFWKVSKWIVED